MIFDFYSEASRDLDMQHQYGPYTDHRRRLRNTETYETLLDEDTCDGTNTITIWGKGGAQGAHTHVSEH